MKYSSLSEKHKKSYKRSLVFMIVWHSILVTFFIGGILTFNSNSMFSVMCLMIASLTFYLALYTLSSFLSNSNNIYLVSLNQKHEYNDTKITVYDEIKGVEIEESYSWKDVSYIERLNFNKAIDVLIGNKSFGLMIILNKGQFYKGINKKNKQIDKIEKRQIKLSGGCFIECNEEDIDIIESYWGKKIKENTY